MEAAAITARGKGGAGSFGPWRASIWVALVVAPCFAACAGLCAREGRKFPDTGRESSSDASTAVPPEISVDSMADASTATAAAEEVRPGANSIEGPWEYPFGHFTDARDAKAGAKFRSLLEQEGGISRAMHRLCKGECTSFEVEDRVARNFLIERADRTYPVLLDAILAADRAPSDDDSECRCAMDFTARSAVCSGYYIFGTGPDFDAHPLAVERRARAQRAFAKAIDGGGPRAELAIYLLLEIGNWANGDPSPAGCAGLADTVRVATSSLVKRLGIPRTPARMPRSVNGDEPNWARALQALSLGGADRAIAEKPVAAFLADDETAPLAALTLARMGADVTAVVPQLARLLDRIELHYVEPSTRRYWDELEQSGDVLDALRAIGKPAHSALPNVAALVLRSELPRCTTRGAASYVRVIRAIATPADADVAVPCLARLLVCPGNDALVVRALGELGATARPALLSVVRDDTRTISERLGAVTALRQAGPESLDDSDRRLSALLQAKSKAWDELIHNRQHAALETMAASEMERCRAEVGLTPGPAPAAGYSWNFAICLSKYLCGPTMETYVRTMEHCLFGASLSAASSPSALTEAGDKVVQGGDARATDGSVAPP
jgi:hypothetical protein